MARFYRIVGILILIASLALPVVGQEATATPEPTTEGEATTAPEPTTEGAATTMPEATAAATQQAESTPTFMVTAPDVAATDNFAFIVFAHASVDGGPADIYIEGLGDGPIVSNLQFGEATDVVFVPAGTHNVSVRAAGSAADTDPIVTFTWDFTGNSTWVVAAVGLMETSSFLLEPVTVVRTPTNGMARVRVVNWVSDIEMLTVSGGDTAFAEGLGWAGVQDTEVAPGTYQLQVTDGADATFGEATSFNFEADMIYTIFLTGSTSMGPEIDFLVVELPQDETRVRFVSERADAVDIHMRPGDELVTSIEAGAASDWFTIPSTAATFIAFAPGTGPTGQEMASLPFQLRPGRDVTVMFRADGTAEVVEETLTPEMDDSGSDNQNTNTNDNAGGTNTNTNDNTGDTNTNDNSGGDDNGNENGNDNS
jgi:hypothetical protein